MPRALVFTYSCYLLAAAACSDEDDRFREYPPPPAPRLGSLEFSWSIDGERDPAACAAAGATTFQSLIVDGGFVVDDIRVPCEDFEASLRLYTDDFRARSALVNVDGYPALRRIVDDLFVIGEGQVTRLVIDFPSPPVPSSPDAGAPPVPAPDAGGIDVIPDTGAPDAGAPDAGAP